VYNNRFQVKAYPPSCWNAETNDINFKPTKEIISKEYRTVFGPHFRTNTQMYHCNNDGIRGAVRRITSTREPENIGLHDTLIENQRGIVGRLGDVLVDWKNWFRNNLSFVTSSKFDATTERNLWCYKTHPKKQLRIAAKMQLIQYGCNKHNRVKRVEYKCKSGELLPPNKYLRAIGDLTTPGSTALGYYMDWVKECFEKEYTVGNSQCVFVKTPDHDKLQNVFNKLMYQQGLFFCFFSDDSCLSVECSDGRLMANLDISACDGSNFSPVFEILKDVMTVDSRYVQDIKDGFKQCMKPCVVHSEDWSEKVILTPTEHVLYSGSVLTTSINNMANTLIFLHLIRLLNGRTLLKEQVKRLIVQASSESGFILKVDECADYSDLQFLKHSPALVNGVVIPYLNIGTMLRGFGTCVGELPGKSKLGLNLRARIFNSDVVKSYKHVGEHAVHDAFNVHIIKKSFGLIIDPSATWRSTNHFETRIPTSELCKRYKFKDVEMEELCHIIGSAMIGQRISSKLIDCIMNKDYGYPV